MPQSAIVEGLQLELAAKQTTVDALLLGFQSPPFPAVDGLSFDMLYQPAATIERLGGDWYEIYNGNLWTHRYGDAQGGLRLRGPSSADVGEAR